jgi:hypothetical protein
MVAGFGAKSAPILFFKIAAVRPFILQLMSIDGTVWLAYKTCNLLFDPRREMPTQNEYLVFNSVLILTFGVECLCLGFIVDEVWSRLRPA